MTERFHQGVSGQLMLDAPPSNGLVHPTTLTGVSGVRGPVWPDYPHYPLLRIPGTISRGCVR
jgi:hypothetical protein